jgi:hypothetical protein
MIGGSIPGRDFSFHHRIQLDSDPINTGGSFPGVNGQSVKLTIHL